MVIEELQMVFFLYFFYKYIFLSIDFIFIFLSFSHSFFLPSFLSVCLSHFPFFLFVYLVGVVILALTQNILKSILLLKVKIIK
jgi:hypothetical protein